MVRNCARDASLTVLPFAQLLASVASGGGGGGAEGKEQAAEPADDGGKVGAVASVFVAQTPDGV